MGLSEKLDYELGEQSHFNKLFSKVAVWKENAIILLDPSIISYITMDKKKVIIHTGDDTYESSSSLEELEKRLSSRGFFRSHKSFIVNIDYIEKIVPWFNSTYVMSLKTVPVQIPVSRSYVKRLKSLLGI